MKKTVLISIALAIFAIALAIIMSLPGSGSDSRVSAPPEPPPPVEELIPAGERDDKDVMVRVLLGSEVVEMTMEKYLIGVVAAEMPAAFNIEALKAQTVAARTDTLYNMYVSQKPRHPEAHVCGDFACCMAYQDDAQLRERWGDGYLVYIRKIIDAVIGTDGVYLAYDGAPILAVFHSSSAGMTEFSGNVWISDLPYLVSAPSPETADSVPNYISTVTLSADDFVEAVQAAYPDAVFGDDAAEWIADIEYTPSGRIASLTVGGVPLSGPALRSMLGLRSTAAEIEIADGDIVFTTTGYGHGVGMSQYGANALAAQGKTYKEILSNYYTGVTFRGESDIEAI